MKKLLIFIKKNFAQGDIKKYLKTLIRLILDIIVFVTLFTLWDIIKNPSSFKTDGTILSWILTFFLSVSIASILAIVIITVIYTLFSPSFWGWLTKKVTKSNQ